MPEGVDREQGSSGDFSLPPSFASQIGDPIVEFHELADGGVSPASYMRRASSTFIAGRLLGAPVRHREPRRDRAGAKQVQ